MTEKIAFTIPDEIGELLRNVCLSDDVENFARTLFLKGLSAEYGSHDDDATMKRIETIIEKLNA